MADLAMGPWGAQSARIRDLALAIVRGAGIAGKDYRGEVDALHDWMREAIRYTRDPVGQERVQTPEQTAFVARSGDCDDAATLEAAFLGAIGHPTRFITIGLTPRAFSHVYLEVFLKGTWLPLDPIALEHPAGWESPKAVIRKVWPVNHEGGFDPAAHLDGLGVLPIVPLLLLGGGAAAGGAVGYGVGRTVGDVSRGFGIMPWLLVGGIAWWIWKQRRPAAGTA
jgi:transglutaminase-like putative cysteine protease